MRSMLLFLIAFFVSTVNAQPVPSIDLGYRAELVPPPPYRIGQQFKLRMIVTNNSTEYFTYAIIKPIPPIPLNVLPFDGFEPTGGTTGCDICLSEVCFETPEIPPQQTAVCESGFIALVSVGNPARQRLKVFHPFNIATDPNPSNDEAQVSVEILPEPVVSVPLNAWSYGFMSFLLLGIGFTTSRKT